MKNGGNYFISQYEGGLWQEIVPTQTDKYIKKQLDNHPLFPPDAGEVAALGGQPSITIPGIGLAFTAIKLPNGKIWDTITGWRT